MLQTKRPQFLTCSVRAIVGSAGIVVAALPTGDDEFPILNDLLIQVTLTIQCSWISRQTQLPPMEYETTNCARNPQVGRIQENPVRAMPQSEPIAATYQASPANEPGVVWLDAMRRADPPHVHLKGPHFPVPTIAWEEFEGWSQEHASMDVNSWPLPEISDRKQSHYQPHQPAPSSVGSIVPTASKALQVTTNLVPDSISVSARLDSSASTAATLPASHANWMALTRLQTVGKRWNRSSTESPSSSVLQREIIKWPAVTDRLLAEAREQLAELSAALLSSQSVAAGGNETTLVRAGTCILVTAKVPDQGATSTSIALSRYLAQTRRRVLLIDADIVTAGLSRALGFVGAIDRSLSLACQLGNFLRRRLISTDVGDGILDILPTQCRPLALHDGREMNETLLDSIADHRSQYDIVVVDGGPLIDHEDHLGPSRFQRLAQLAQVGLVIRRPLDSSSANRPPIEPRLAAWGLRRIVIANILSRADMWPHD